MPRGRLISLEGGEGAGKTTQLPRLVRALESAGIAVLATREPGGSAGAEAIRRLLLEGDSARWDAQQEVLLLMAARRDHVARLIEPALARGKWVVCDRFADSTLAYQGYGRGLNPADIAALQRFALGNFAPDLTLILDVPVEIGQARIASRSADADRFERLDQAFHQRLRQGFHDIAAANPGRCMLIDATGEVEAVHCAVLDAVARRLGVRFAAGGPSERPASVAPGRQ
ncbi:MAG TPA: dTMP kinase [Stellaceae bacterium]|jgi:dTMP kinase